MSKEYYALASQYIGIVVWFALLIAGKIAILNKNKRLTNRENISNIIYCIIGGVMAYFGTFSFQYHLKVIAVGIGVMAGDVLVSWLPSNVKEWLELVGQAIKSWIRRKSK